MIKLTVLERAVLETLFKSSEDNGHDFGLIESARKAVTSPRQLSGIISSLSKKKLLTVDSEGVTTDSGHWTQFTFDMTPEQVRAVLDVNAMVDHLEGR